MIAKFSRFRKKKAGGLFLIIFTGFLIATAVIFLIVLNLKINQERAKLQSAIENLAGELEKSQAKREELLSKISEAQTDAYLEEIARQELNLQKEGEKVVAFVLKEKAEEGEKDEKETIWGKISDWLLEKLKIRRD